MTPDVAALMLTNPNTLGMFEDEICEAARIVHEKGGLVLLRRREHERAGRQGASGRLRRGHHAPEPAQDVLHAARRGRAGVGSGGGRQGARSVSARCRSSGPRATGMRLDYDRPLSIGRVKAFQGNFGMIVRAYAYIRSLGPDGIRADVRERGAERELRARAPARHLRGAVRSHQHARSDLLGPQAERVRRDHARHREAAHRPRLPSADDLLPADRARGADGGADRERGPGRTRPLRGRDAADCRGSEDGRRSC